jgi:flavin-binding protein dodecin
VLTGSLIGRTSQRLVASNSFRSGALELARCARITGPRHGCEERSQTTTIARVTEISAQSPKSFEDAIQQGIARASKALRNIQSAWIKDQQVSVDGKVQITNYRVDMKVTFVLED